ncbi:hypothetical protein K6V98_03445 [Collinsella sp. AGMB00827]|uniref:DUF4352 domain-containing protein n=1 Tax=Collinsella ureilytica TaxID=2869515 RepID=A0ABS7MJ67_9ACTN|nr:hypothetical protein [Collinsella urealyticum]MBY4797416.1 hypothetical protein [Collinsella urealyticum]
MKNTQEIDQVLMILARRRRRTHVLVAVVIAILVCGGGGFVAMRTRALAQEFPNPPRETYEVGSQIEYPGRDGVLISVQSHQLLSDEEAQELCPDVYRQNGEVSSSWHMVRVDLTVTNQTDKEITLHELRSSNLVIGETYANQSDMMAEAEAFPDIEYKTLASGSTVTLPLLYTIFDFNFLESQWKNFNNLPMKLQLFMWPKVMSVKL